MGRLKFLATIAVLSAAMLAPGLSEVQAHHRHHRHHANRLPYPISYLHNYGPGLTPGTFAHYDGPNNYCFQSSSAYIGQDRRRHPCF